MQRNNAAFYSRLDTSKKTSFMLPGLFPPAKLLPFFEKTKVSHADKANPMTIRATQTALFPIIFSPPKTRRVFSSSGTEKAHFRPTGGQERGLWNAFWGQERRKSGTFGVQMWHFPTANVPQSEGKSPTVGGQKWHFCAATATQEIPQNTQHTAIQ